MNDRVNAENRAAVSDWENDGGARGSDAERRPGTAPVARDRGLSQQEQLMRATNPTHAGSIGMPTCIKPDGNRKTGSSGTI